MGIQLGQHSKLFLVPSWLRREAAASRHEGAPHGRAAGGIGALLNFLLLLLLEGTRLHVHLGFYGRLHLMEQSVRLRRVTGTDLVRVHQERWVTFVVRPRGRPLCSWLPGRLSARSAKEAADADELCCSGASGRRGRPRLEQPQRVGTIPSHLPGPISRVPSACWETKERPLRGDTGHVLRPRREHRGA